MPKQRWRRLGPVGGVVVACAVASAIGGCGGGDEALPPLPAKLTVVPDANAPPPVGQVTTTLPPTTTSLPGSQTYTVADGDTLYGIATRYSTTMATLLALNRFSDPNNIVVGQRIIVPAPPTTTTTAAPSTTVGQPGLGGTGTGGGGPSGTTPSATTSPAATASTLPAATENG